MENIEGDFALLEKEKNIYDELCKVQLNQNLIDFIKILKIYKEQLVFKYEVLQNSFQTNDDLLEKNFTHIDELDILVTKQFKYIIDDIEEYKKNYTNLKNDFKSSIDEIHEKIFADHMNAIRLSKIAESKCDKSISKIQKEIVSLQEKVVSLQENTVFDFNLINAKILFISQKNDKHSNLIIKTFILYFILWIFILI
jgi:hypothetical protein